MSMDEIGDQEIHEHISIIFFEDILFCSKARSDCGSKIQTVEISNTELESRQCMQYGLLYAKNCTAMLGGPAMC